MPAFDTTRWTLLARIRDGAEPEADDAMEIVCRSYWTPLYAWLRGNGNSPEAAQDLVQGFFAHALRRDLFRKADAAKGTLRGFLLRSLRNYLADVQQHENRQKRAGRRNEISLDFINAEHAESGLKLDLESPDADPAEIYERRWGRAILQSALAALRAEYAEKGKEAQFDSLNPLLANLEPGTSYQTVAENLEISEGAARIAFHRFKTRFRELVSEEVERTLLPEDDLDEELRYLAKVLS